MVAEVVVLVIRVILVGIIDCGWFVTHPVSARRSPNDLVSASSPDLGGELEVGVVGRNVDPREVLVDLEVDEVSHDLVEKTMVGSSVWILSGGGNGSIGNIVVSPCNGPK